MRLLRNIKEGKKTNKAAGGVILITIIGYTIAGLWPLSPISQIMIENAAEIWGTVSIIAASLATLFKK